MNAVFIKKRSAIEFYDRFNVLHVPSNIIHIESANGVCRVKTFSKRFKYKLVEMDIFIKLLLISRY